MIRLRELVMILDLHQQGLSVSAIARQLECDRKTVRKYIERGLKAPAYGPRQPRATVVAAFETCLRERIAAFPELTGSRLLREIKELGSSDIRLSPPRCSIACFTMPSSSTSRE